MEFGRFLVGFWVTRTLRQAPGDSNRAQEGPGEGLASVNVNVRMLTASTENRWKAAKRRRKRRFLMKNSSGTGAEKTLKNVKSKFFIQFIWYKSFIRFIQLFSAVRRCRKNAVRVTIAV
jgi:hypothetical protein